MKSLSDQDSRRLFFNRIFGSENDCPPQLKDVSTQILKKCGGLPLAIIAIASLLASHSSKEKEQWKSIVNSLDTMFGEDPSLEKMRLILNLSYMNLPYYLKTCLLYIGIYPEDYEIDKNDLVRRWVAEGFLSNVPRLDMENHAKRYFDELVNRSMIQPVRINYNDEVLTYRVHDIILDFIRDKSKEENFITIIDNSQVMIRLHDKVRRLSLDFNGARVGRIPQTVALSQVRSLVIFGTSTYLLPLLEFKFLRVLAIEFPISKHEMRYDLTGISQLFQLRYLKLVSPKFSRDIELPTQIWRLQHLETLEIIGGWKLAGIPSDIHSLNLLHLIIPIFTRLPDGIGRMNSLHTLKEFYVKETSLDNIKALRELTNMRDLTLRFSRDYTGRCTDALCSSLEKLNGHSLKYLSLHCEALCDLSSLSPSLDSLEKLILSACLFPRVPKWIGQLHNLQELRELHVDELSKDGVHILGELPALISLCLWITEVPKKKIVVYSMAFLKLKYFKLTCGMPCLTFKAGAMPCLQRIKINCGKPCLTFHAGAMPSLQRLQMCFNARGWEQHGIAPVGIEHLSRLKNVSVNIGDTRADESDIRAAESALRNAIDEDHHPNHPRVNIKWINFLPYFFREVDFKCITDDDEESEEDEEDKGVNSSK